MTEPVRDPGVSRTIDGRYWLYARYVGRAEQ
jgi:hypothetical protein